MALKKSVTKSLYALAIARVGIGLVFIWAFFDKLLGLGFATCRDKTTDMVHMACSQAWIHGGSPTVGFLKFGTKGPLADFYQSLAGHSYIDWLFMLGLLLIGIALVTGIAIKVATTAGSLLLLMMWSAALWPANNPVLDEHLIYIAVLAAVMISNSDQQLGMGKWWANQPIVKRLPIFQ